jgi:hypothetical protein
MASGNLKCPNSACQQKYLVIDTEEFVCSACGTRIDAQKEIDEFGRLKADARKSALRRKKRKAIIAKFHLYLFGFMALAGFIFREIGRVALLALVVFGSAAVYARFKRNGLAQGFLLATIATLVFFIFSLVGDTANPPTAECVDGSYSYSAHDQGTCSWHGGIREWNPPPWWEQY